MKSKMFKGKDEVDLNKQVWNWRSANPNISVMKAHPIKRLPIDLSKPTGKFGKKPSAPDSVSISIDYEDSN